jgi:hypothetical protein
MHHLDMPLLTLIPWRCSCPYVRPLVLRIMPTITANGCRIQRITIITNRCRHNGFV